MECTYGILEGSVVTEIVEKLTLETQNWSSIVHCRVDNQHQIFFGPFINRGSPPRTTGANGRKNGGAFKTSVEIRIPNELIGKLIGKNGSTVQQLKQQCGVFLEVDDLKEAAKDTTVHLKGTLSQVTMAQTLLQVILASKQRAS